MRFRHRHRPNGYRQRCRQRHSGGQRRGNEIALPHGDRGRFKSRHHLVNVSVGMLCRQETRETFKDMHAVFAQQRVKQRAKAFRGRKLEIEKAREVCEFHRNAETLQAGVDPMHHG